MRALDMAKKDRQLPHMHIDTKTNDFGGNQDRRSGKNFQNGKRFERPFGESRSERRNFDRASRRDGGARYPKNKDMMPMQYRTSNASLYKKHKNCD